MLLSNESLRWAIGLSIACSSLAQLLLKAGMKSGDCARAASAGDWAGMLVCIAVSPQVLAGLALYALSMLLWLAVLSQAELSYAYPFVGLGFVLTLVFAWAVLGEAVTAPRVAGTLLIAVGVMLVAATRPAP